MWWCSRGRRLRSMYPEYIGDANAYEFVAVADLAKGDKKAAVRADGVREDGRRGSCAF